MEVRTSTLLITYSPELFNGEPILFSSNSLPMKASHYEPAGHSFHSAALKLSGYDEEEDADTDTQSVQSDDKGQAYMPSYDSYSTKGKKKSDSANKQQDHYALLGLAHLRFLATEEQIRKSYREALKHHPNKQAALLLTEETEEGKQAKMDEIESNFKSIQEAYEVLIDPVKRRIYDSTDEFDDEIPTDCAPQDFYKVFGPAFMRNGRWSVNLPVPNLGDDKSPLDYVDNFYNFWYGFKSWREVPHADEFELDQAESRDHKRWMERQNVKQREKARKEEHVRVRTLVDNAYKKDPRILRRKEEDITKKKLQKEVKYLAKKLQKEEAARVVEEERRKKEEDDKRAAETASNQKKQKEKEKKLLRKERTRLRALSTSIAKREDSIVSTSSDSFLEKRKPATSSASPLTSRAESEGLPAVAGVVQESSPEVTSTKLQCPVVEVGTQNTPNGVSSSSEQDVWSAVQEQDLIQALKTFPKGTSQRWERVATAVPGKTVNQCKKKFTLMKVSFRGKKSAN